MSGLGAVFVGVLIAAVPATIAALFAKRKTGAEAASEITDAATLLVREFRMNVDDLKVEIDELRAEVVALRALVISLGGDPFSVRRAYTRKTDPKVAEL